MPQHLPMFVFGTLRYGESNHHFLEHRYHKRLAAELDGYANVESEIGYPMIDLNSGDSVTGELFFLSEQCYDKTLIEIDELELLPPGELIGEWYERTTVSVSTTEGDFTAWAYVKPQN